MSQFPHRDLVEALTSAGLGVSVVAGWPSSIDAPAIVVAPQSRVRTPPCSVTWTLRLSVVAALAQDSEVVNDLTEAALAALPAGYVAGDTTYSQRSIGGVDAVFADTAITATR